MYRYVYASALAPGPRKVPPPLLNLADCSHFTDCSQGDMLDSQYKSAIVPTPTRPAGGRTEGLVKARGSGLLSRGSPL